MSTPFVFEFFSSGGAKLLSAIAGAATVAGVLRKIVRRREMAWGVFFPLAVVAAIFIWNEWLPELIASTVHSDTSRVIRSTIWITYDPHHLSLEEPLDVHRIRRELVDVRAAGFTGIVTYACDGVMGEIPRIAAESGLHVITGVWNPKDRGELANAIAAKEWTDAYCVGHLGLREGRYTPDELVRAMELIRFRTARPVSTTEPLDRYQTDRVLARHGDFLFPDMHFSGRNEEGDYDVDVGRDVQYIVDGARSIVQWDAQDGRGREIVLQSVAYPYGGVPTATPETQRQFFARLLEQRRDSRSAFPDRVSIVAHTAYDAVWKVSWPFYTWDTHIALFDDEGNPRPAVGEIVHRK